MGYAFLRFIGRHESFNFIPPRHVFRIKAYPAQVVTDFPEKVGGQLRAAAEVQIPPVRRPVGICFQAVGTGYGGVAGNPVRVDQINPDIRGGVEHVPCLTDRVIELHHLDGRKGQHTPGHYLTILPDKHIYHFLRSFFLLQPLNSTQNLPYLIFFGLTFEILDVYQGRGNPGYFKYSVACAFLSRLTKIMLADFAYIYKSYIRRAKPHLLQYFVDVCHRQYDTTIGVIVKPEIQALFGNTAKQTFN